MIVKRKGKKFRVNIQKQEKKGTKKIIKRGQQLKDIGRKRNNMKRTWKNEGTEERTVRNLKRDSGERRR